VYQRGIDSVCMPQLFGCFLRKKCVGMYVRLAAVVELYCCCELKVGGSGRRVATLHAHTQTLGWKRRARGAATAHLTLSLTPVEHPGLSHSCFVRCFELSSL
jgi:hypothetical protein